MQYNIVADPAGSTAVTTFTCTNATNCTLTGLSPATTYTITASATLADGSTTPASAPATMATPALGAPTLLSAVATGPTTALATARPPASGGPFTNYTFTAAPAGGSSGGAVTCLSTTPRCTFAGLTPATLYAVSVRAYSSSGIPTPTSNARFMATSPMP